MKHTVIYINVVNMTENKKHINVLLLSILLILCGSNLFGQTYATDFTATDCNGVSHNLFSELDSGKIIVIAWVMPCGPCVTHALPAYVSALSYSTSHPGKVLFYMADDYANTDCSSLTSWATSNQMTESTVFSDASIKMTDYGSAGMPKAIVLGGNDHKVYFNEKEANITTQGVNDAINQALGGSNNIKENSNLKLHAYPNPANNTLYISYELNQKAELSYEIFNLSGLKVLKNKVTNSIGEKTSEIDISKLSNGTYFLRITDIKSEMIMFAISK